MTIQSDIVDNNRSLHIGLQLKVARVGVIIPQACEGPSRKHKVSFISHFSARNACHINGSQKYQISIIFPAYLQKMLIVK